MSAFVCLFHRDGTAVDPHLLRRLADALPGDGGDVLSTFHRGPLGIAVRHRGGPGAEERHGPHRDPESGRVVAVAGRLRLAGVEPGSPRDGAGAVLDRLRRCATGAPAGNGDADPLAGVRGAFALVTADPNGGPVQVVRAPLGDLPVHYVLSPDRLVAASDPAALLPHPAVSSEPDPATAVRFLGFRTGSAEASFFRDVRRLPPGHRLRVDGETETVERYWRFRALPELAERPTEGIVEDFVHRLGEAIGDSLAGVDPDRVALSLSGGLDSTAVAALTPGGVAAFSWCFRELPEADETPAVDAVVRHLGLPLIRVPGDGLHPLGEGFPDRFVHPGSPFVNPFAALKARLYGAAREAGRDRILVGDGGDALYAARDWWLGDLLRDRRPGAPGSLLATLGRAARGDRFARRALRRLLPLDRWWGSQGLRPRPPWLTPAARALLPPPEPSPVLPPGPGHQRHEAAVGLKHSELQAEEWQLFARCGVERHDPFWSWPLLELAIQLPAWWYHRDGEDKVLSRRALAHRLPAEVVAAPRGGLLGGLFLRGLELHREEVREWVFRRPRSDWPRHVRREWVEPYLGNAGGKPRSIAFGHTILWRVICYELWHRRLLRGA